MTRDKTEVSLNQMLDYASEVIGILEGVDLQHFESNRLMNLAVVHLIEIIGEAANRVPVEAQARYTSVLWREIINMRNVIAHGYDAVDLETVWKVAMDDLPPLVASLQQILNRD